MHRLNFAFDFPGVLNLRNTQIMRGLEVKPRGRIAVSGLTPRRSSTMSFKREVGIPRCFASALTLMLSGVVMS
jgi:hypothetical protein